MSLFNIMAADLIKSGRDDFDGLSDHEQTNLFLAFANEVSPIEMQRFLGSSDKCAQALKSLVKQFYYCQTESKSRLAFQFAENVLGNMFRNYLPDMASKYDNQKYLLNLENGTKFGGTD